LQPDDFKPMPSIGAGVEELRICDETGTFRIIYAARFANVVLVLHAFQKKTAATPRNDIETARRRLALAMKGEG
jgi:phage-related protein